jgi:uncharacterized protein (DUF2147 family)
MACCVTSGSTSLTNRMADPSRAPARSWSVRLAVLGLALGLAWPAQAQRGPVGDWLDADRSGVIAFTPCGQALCGRIVGMLMDHPNEPTPRDHTGRSECNLVIIDDATETHPGSWNGHITDPRNGFVYSVRLWLDKQGRLHLRGYLFFPALGQTQIWTRYTGGLPADCRLTAADVALARSSKRHN